ncbi:MAG: hypothetical protein ACXWC7_15875, partial [Chitinophagaceae bacterium]
TEQNLRQYEVESSIDSVNFMTKEIMIAKNQATGNDYSFDENIIGIQKIFYRLRMTNKDGKWDYSKTIALENKSAGKTLFIPQSLQIT